MLTGTFLLVKSRNVLPPARQEVKFGAMLTLIVARKFSPFLLFLSHLMVIIFTSVYCDISVHGGPLLILYVSTSHVGLLIRDYHHPGFTVIQIVTFALHICSLVIHDKKALDIICCIFLYLQVILAAIEAAKMWSWSSFSLPTMDNNQRKAGWGPKVLFISFQDKWLLVRNSDCSTCAIRIRDLAHSPSRWCRRRRTVSHRVQRAYYFICHYLRHHSHNDSASFSNDGSSLLLHPTICLPVLFNYIPGNFQQVSSKRGISVLILFTNYHGRRTGCDLFVLEIWYTVEGKVQV